MSALKFPGVLADHWPWGPPRAIVVIPRQYGLVCDMTYVVNRSGKDIAGRSYQETNQATWHVLTRAEAARHFKELLPRPILKRVMGEVDQALRAHRL